MDLMLRFLHNMLVNVIVSIFLYIVLIW